MTQHIYFLGIGGTLMGSLALLARESGLRVSGSDKALYPPMSDQLAAADIAVYEGFDPAQLNPAPDLVVIGNAQLPRGHAGVEYVLDHGIPYTSGAEWLGRQILNGRWVLAVSGTHGKTTTASMLAHILDRAGLNPGFLIGGVPKDFGISARLGSQPFFVVEADEYDTSYFDRRSKFVHYRPRTLVINNLEYDHADIFPDLASIQTQFHHLLRTVPSRRADRCAGTRRSRGPRAPHGMLDACRACPRQPTTAQSRTGRDGQWRTVAREKRFVRRFPVHAATERHAARRGEVGPARPAQRRERFERDRRGAARRRTARGRNRSTRFVSRRHTSARADRGGRQHQRLRRLCAPPDRDSNHVAGLAQSLRRRRDHRGDRTPFTYDVARHAARRTVDLLRGRRQRVLVPR